MLFYPSLGLVVRVPRLWQTLWHCHFVFGKVPKVAPLCPSSLVRDGLLDERPSIPTLVVVFRFIDALLRFPLATPFVCDASCYLGGHPHVGFMSSPLRNVGLPAPQVSSCHFVHHPQDVPAVHAYVEMLLRCLGPIVPLLGAKFRHYPLLLVDRGFSRSGFSYT